MKKFLIIALILIMIPAAIFAKGFSFGLGATASTGATINGVIENKIDDLKFENFVYGGYANVKLFFVSANATLFPKFDNKDAVYFAGDLSANFAIDLVVFRVQAGLSINYFGATDFSDWTFSFETENIKDAPVSLRGEVDLMLGELSVGVWGLLPTTATLNTLTDIFEVKDRWKDATLGLSLGVCF